jgi:transposase
MVHDRDINAARNILKVAQRHWETVSHATRGTINACGEDVRHACMQSFMNQEGGRSC